MWSQIETINKIQEQWKERYEKNLALTSKLPFYNLCKLSPPLNGKKDVVG